MASFSEEQVLRLCQAEHKFKVEPVAFLGKGTYNMAWEVKSKRNPHPMVLRMSLEPMNIYDINPELRLYQKFRQLHIGIPMKKGAILPTGPNEGVLAILTQKGNGTLHDYLNASIQMGIQVEDVAKSAIQAIRDTVEAGYFCADVKPENMLVTDNKVYMADFDPNFCQRNEWLNRLCTAKGIPKGCKLHKDSVRTFRDLLTRVLIFQLHLIIMNIGYGNTRSEKFARYLYRHGIENVKPIERRRAIRVGNVSIPPLEVLRYMLDESYEYTEIVLNHYARRKGTVYTKAFQDALSNFWNLQNISPKPKKKTTKKLKIGESCIKDSQCYSRTCKQGKCTRKNS